MIKNCTVCGKEFECQRNTAKYCSKECERKARKIRDKNKQGMHDIDKFDCDFFGINPQEAEYMDPSQRMLLQSSYHALEDAGYGEKNIRGANVGMYVAYSVMIHPS